VAVICPSSVLPGVAAALADLDVDFGTPAAGALDDTISLLPVEAAKGLEFDSVIVVEPARIVEDSVRGLRGLYVALTRATRRLAVIHAAPLPLALGG
jgi:superfamily I DNA/RNA helicase